MVNVGLPVATSYLTTLLDSQQEFARVSTGLAHSLVKESEPAQAFIWWDSMAPS